MRRALLVVALLLAPAVALPKSGYLVIAHPGVAAEALTRSHLSDLFLKKVSRWPNGLEVVPVQPPEDADVRGAFSQEVHGKSAAAVKAYWNKLIFSGREVPPIEKASDEEIVTFVRSHPGAIGYVALGCPTQGVKVLRVND